MHQRGIRLLCVVLAAIVVAAGCTRRDDASGAGEDVDVCWGHRIMDTLDEPRVGEPDEVRAYVAAMRRIAERIRPDYPIRRREAEPLVPPPATAADLETLVRELDRFGRELEEAGGRAPDVRVSVNRFAANDAYNGAEARLAAFVDESCPRR